MRSGDVKEQKHENGSISCSGLPSHLEQVDVVAQGVAEAAVEHEVALEVDHDDGRLADGQLVVVRGRLDLCGGADRSDQFSGL